MSSYDLSPKLAPGVMERIELLLAKHCPRLMVQGGGALGGSGTTLSNYTRSKITPEQMAHVCGLAKDGMCREHIAREAKLSVSSVQWILRDAGLKAKDGRAKGKATA